ncbi:MAG: hypothetical protein ACRBB5_06760 [Nitrosopumilus sp.]
MIFEASRTEIPGSIPSYGCIPISLMGVFGFTLLDTNTTSEND